MSRENKSPSHHQGRKGHPLARYHLAAARPRALRTRCCNGRSRAGLLPLKVVSASRLPAGLRQPDSGRRSATPLRAACSQRPPFPARGTLLTPPELVLSISLSQAPTHVKSQPGDGQVLSWLAMQVEKGVHPRIDCRLTKLLLDAQKLVVLGHAVRATRGTGLDLASVEGDGQVSDGGVFSFPTTV